MRSSLIALIAILLLPAPLLRAADDQPPPAKKQPSPPPDTKAQADALAKIKTIFADDYKNHSGDDCAPLIKKLLESAPESDTDLPAQFMLYKEAWRLAISIGDVKSALEAMDGICGSFTVDPAEWRKATVDRLGQARLSAAETRLAAKDWIDASQAALEAKDIDRLIMSLTGVDAMLRYIYDVNFTRQAQEKLQPARDIVAQYRRVKPAIDALQQGQKDPAAGTKAGQFFCLYLNDFDRGLPLLCNCDNTLLQSAARLDTAGGTTAEAQVAIGDAWWDAAQKETAMARDGVERAAFWYRQAEDNLKGLELVRIKQRLASMSHRRGIDLLAMATADLEKNTLEGKWETTPNGIVAHALATIGFSYQVPREYDVEVEATPQGDGTCLGINLSRNNARVCLLIAGFADSNIGFELVKNLRANENSTSKNIPHMWTVKQRHVITAQVRDDGINVLIDGKQVCAYIGDYSDVAPFGAHEQAGKPGTISVFEFSGSIVIHSVTLFEVSGSGKKI